MKATHFRWIILTLLFFITVTNYIDRAAISYAIEEMANTFHLDDEKVGLILGAFGIGYMVTTFLGGIAVDRMGAKTILAFAVALWSASIFFTGMAVGFAMIFIARITLGLAEGPNFPGLARAVSDWLPANERARAFSFGLIAVPVALALGGPVCTQLIAHLSWQKMFYVLGAIGLLWVPIWLWLFKNFPNQSEYVNKEELKLIQADSAENLAQPSLEDRKHIKGLWKYLFTEKTLLVNYWAFFVFGYCMFFYMTWLPPYLSSQYHLKVTEVGWFSVLPWSLAAIFMWFVGAYSDKVFARTKSLRRSRSYSIAFTQLLSGLCIVPVAIFHEIHVALFFISLAVGFCMSANAAYYAINVDVAKERAGTALGVMDTGFAIAGFISPTVTGWVVEVTGHFEVAFLFLSLLTFSSFILVMLCHCPDEAKGLS